MSIPCERTTEAQEVEGIESEDRDEGIEEGRTIMEEDMKGTKERRGSKRG